MARRPDPERLYLASRAGLLSRLEAQAHLSPEKAEEWMRRWEAEAASRGLDRRSGEFRGAGLGVDRGAARLGLRVPAYVGAPTQPPGFSIFAPAELTTSQAAPKQFRPSPEVSPALASPMKE